MASFEKLPTTLATNFLGDTFEVISGDYIGDIIKKTGAFSQRELYMLASIFSLIPVQNCLEIGANIGNHTSLFSRFFKTTHAFEPNPFIYEILRRNIERNELRVTPHCLGISNESAEQPFYIDGHNLGASSFVKEHVLHPSAIIQAQVVIGDAFVEREGIDAIDYIKIDAEGLEGKIVQGLHRTIKRHQPLISLEWNCDETRKDFRHYDIFQTTLAGYSAYSIVKPFPRQAYQGVIKQVQRFILRHVLYRSQKLTLGSFNEANNYDMVVLFPERFQVVPEKIRYSEIIHPFQ